MPRDGSGNFSLTVNSWNPATNGTPATAADWQSLINDVASAVSASVAKDGQTAMTGDLSLGGNKITNLDPGTATTDAVNKNQLNTLDSTGISAYMKTVLDDADAETAQTTLDVPSRTGTGASGSWAINAATVTNGVYTVGTQTIAGATTFSSQVVANAGAKLSDGSDLQLHAATGNDAGDLLFLSSTSAEIGRIWRDPAADQFFVRFSSVDSTKVLTHNQNVGVQQAALAVGAIGTIALLKEDNTTNRAPGDTVAGSSLQYSTASGAFPSVINPSGTWRCMGYKWGGGTGADRVTAWMRIA